MRRLPRIEVRERDGLTLDYFNTSGFEMLIDVIHQTQWGLGDLCFSRLQVPESFANVSLF